MGERSRQERPILLAEDSPLLLEMLKKCLTQAGYVNLIPTTNGQEAWNKLNQMLSEGAVIGKDIALVITDIEMPQMDGHHLTKKIKNDPRFEGLPVVIFSSLVNEEMKRKGEALGADAQLSKPEIGKLVHQLDLLLQ
jgi:two-component system chemotaxis response regulator CheV